MQRLVAGAQGKAIDDAAVEKRLAGLSPYRGLLPFREQDAGLFFGRKRFVDELVEKVRQRTATNVVAVIGRSGSGKSSIVYAGLFPALRREQGVGGGSVWQILDLRPHDEPLHQLAAAFDPPKAEPGSLEYRAALNEGAKLFRERKVTLAELVRDRLRDESGQHASPALCRPVGGALHVSRAARDQDRRGPRARRGRQTVHRPRARSGGQLALHARPQRPLGFLPGHADP